MRSADLLAAYDVAENDALRFVEELRATGEAKCRAAEECHEVERISDAIRAALATDMEQRLGGEATTARFHLALERDEQYQTAVANLKEVDQRGNALRLDEELLIRKLDIAMNRLDFYSSLAMGRRVGQLGPTPEEED